MAGLGLMVVSGPRDDDSLIKRRLRDRGRVLERKACDLKGIAYSTTRWNIALEKHIRPHAICGEVDGMN